MTKLENPMVMVDYYAGITAEPAYTCPHCRTDWYEISDGRYESDGYMAIRRHPAHGHGCMECLWDGRTQEDAYRYLMEQDDAEIRRVLMGVINDLGAAWIMRMLHDTEADIVEQNAEAWADDEDGYLEWLANNKED